MTDIGRIGIVGAGPGGLALAQGLRKHGFDVRVFERDRVRADYVQGFRLRIRSRGLDALADALPSDLYQAVLDTAGRAPTTTFAFDDALRPLTDERGGGGGDDVHLEKSVSRITLRQILLTGLDDVIAYDRSFSGYRETADGGVLALFADGAEERFDLLVGADGARSVLRGQLAPEASLIDTGARRFAGKIALDVAEKEGLAAIFRDHNVNIRPRAGRSLMVTSHRVDPAAFARHGLIGGNDPGHSGFAGSHFDNTASYVWWNIAFWQDEIAADSTLDAANGIDLLALLSDYTRAWHPDIHRLFALTDPSTVAALRVRSSVPFAAWPTRRVTLLGDALHSMTYFRALGANSAIHDAGLLLRALRAARDGTALTAALAGYEAAARAHGFAAVADSLTALERALGPRQPVAA